jgi:hypothetical protein
MKPLLQRPDRPIQRPRSGSGRRYRSRAEMWLWPLPPAGSLTFVCTWPAEEVEETSADIGAARLSPRPRGRSRCGQTTVRSRPAKMTSWSSNTTRCLRHSRMYSGLRSRSARRTSAVPLCRSEALHSAEESRVRGLGDHDLACALREWEQPGPPGCASSRCQRHFEAGRQPDLSPLSAPNAC